MHNEARITTKQMIVLVISICLATFMYGYYNYTANSKQIEARFNAVVHKIEPFEACTIMDSIGFPSTGYVRDRKSNIYNCQGVRWLNTDFGKVAYAYSAQGTKGNVAQIEINLTIRSDLATKDKTQEQQIFEKDALMGMAELAGMVSEKAYKEELKNEVRTAISQIEIKKKAYFTFKAFNILLERTKATGGYDITKITFMSK